MGTLIPTLAKALPDPVFRSDLGRLTNHILHPKTQANKDSLGTGIPGSFLIGRKVAYPRENVLLYIEQMIRPRATSKRPSALSSEDVKSPLPAALEFMVHQATTPAGRVSVTNTDAE